MWTDRPESDEEILTRLSSGFGSLEDWDEADEIAEETKAVDKPVRRRKSFIRPGTQKFDDLASLPAFGMWADRPETDEELLDKLRSGWGPPPGDE
jgi:hypothetical protein